MRRVAEKVPGERGLDRDQPRVQRRVRHPQRAETMLNGQVARGGASLFRVQPAHCSGYFLSLGPYRCCGPSQVGLEADLARAAAPVGPKAQEVARAMGRLDAEKTGTPAGYLAVEHRLRPLRVADAPLDTWLVPIQPSFSGDLFGYPTHLLNRPDNLGMSLEHVYYRSGKSGETAPARILWYVSGPHHGVVMGCSSLIEVADGEPKELYRKFRRLGVYTYQQVQASAGKSGTVRALHVIDTQLFASPVPARTLDTLCQRHGQSLWVRSPRKIKPELFADILREGRTK